MRTFIAIELPQEIKDFLAGIQNKLRTTQADVKWVAPQNIHLTLKFLGEIDDKKLDKVCRILEGSLQDKVVFHISLSSIGAFPKINYPRVIWVGIDEGAEQLKETAKTLEDASRKIGIPKEDRPFSCHITIGRLRSSVNRERLSKELDTLSRTVVEKPLEFPVTKVTLFKSTLTPKGPIYETIKEAALKPSIILPYN